VVQHTNARHIYNLLLPNDLIKASTIRRVVTESQTGSTEKSSHRISLTIKVEDVFFDTQVLILIQAMMLRVNGRNVEENKWVKLGAYHTIDLEAHRPFTITKQEWDSISLDRIEAACDVPANNADCKTSRNRSCGFGRGNGAHLSHYRSYDYRAPKD
jgi:protein pelota